MFLATMLKLVHIVGHSSVRSPLRILSPATDLEKKTSGDTDTTSEPLLSDSGAYFVLDIAWTEVQKGMPQADCQQALVHKSVSNVPSEGEPTASSTDSTTNVTVTAGSTSDSSLKAEAEGMQEDTQVSWYYYAPVQDPEQSLPLTVEVL